MRSWHFDISQWLSAFMTQVLIKEVLSKWVLFKNKTHVEKVLSRTNFMYISIFKYIWDRYNSLIIYTRQI